MSNALSPEQALNKAIIQLGSQIALANLVGVSQPSVWKWVHQQKALPARFALTVEAATGISRHDLAPEFYPRDLASSSEGPSA